MRRFALFTQGRAAHNGLTGASMNLEEKNAQEFKTTCGGIIKDPSHYPSAEYQGGRVFFCTQACLRVFREDPDAFMAGEVEHPLNEE